MKGFTYDFALEGFSLRQKIKALVFVMMHKFELSADHFLNIAKQHHTRVRH